MKIKTENSSRVNVKRLQMLLKDLIDIYSPTGKEEEALEYIETYLKKHELPVTRQEVDENRYNLIVHPQKKERNLLYFIGHLDTVSAYDLDDYGFRKKGDSIFGLGTADMKSGCAAMLEAFTILNQITQGILPAGLALVVGEEEDSSGAKVLVKELDFNWSLVGEPTNLIPCLGHYSYMEVLLRTEGKRAHSSMPELGQNAIESMLKLLLKITEYATTKHEELVYNIRQLQSFPRGFVVPDACEAWLDLHLPPSSNTQTFELELKELVRANIDYTNNLNAELTFEETFPGYQIYSNKTIIRKLKETYKRMNLKWETQDFRSHSDGNILWAAGVNPIILGPGSLEAAHTPEESISFNQVVQAAKLYANYALSLQ